jgi:8-oxo-dGTP pyrophosphatase MutT (NUDIX family)
VKITRDRQARRPRCKYCRRGYLVMRWQDADNSRGQAIWACLRHTRRAIRELQARDVREGFWPCAPGQHRHYGALGAAGMLPVTVRNGQTWVLLSERAGFLQSGGTWSTFGGAVNAGEDEWQAARRETAEETNGLRLSWTSAYSEAGRHVALCPHGCGWAYTTFPVLAEPTRVYPKGSETKSVRWILLGDVETMTLHPAFARAWPALREYIASVKVGAIAGEGLTGPKRPARVFRGQDGAADYDALNMRTLPERRGNWHEWNTDHPERNGAS